ncbi:MAG: cysteine--tRNA ligase, partial [Planctomycetales bacterium]|nr:cysteine--tRNA ligase [Planctomycetales bacterium]NIM07616.1 cysteine--tRNA ligase [Planctomycetales bacterium]NIN07122.1 cysteine--tRNA ligase [Planctomycetales bacterium]NIN76216.1 cysteine--tRNA ligase [Planctomycetales bacterium]NIO33438.1 cysteine--tRNA ligase [Planctomycetales bacterium]
MSTAATNVQPLDQKSVTANLQIYNTLTRTKEPLDPITPGKVGIYLCGPTVYDKAHIGHMVGPVIFDAIKRYLTYSGYEVTWVVNITDVDDKLIHKANQRGISMAEVAAENTEDYLANLAGMGVDGIDQMPTATASMPDIIAFTQALIEQGFAYEADGDVFFDVTQDPDYGKLTNRTLDDLQGEGGEAAAKKRSSADFALWKAAKPGEPSWDSPWGQGRPGWHIECSAMSRKILGESFDIHGGGLDLIFPHHENEIAQSESCHGKPMARFWMHNGLLRASASAGKVGGRGEREGDPSEASQKMSRSKGAGGLAELIAHHGGQRIRFFLLRTHYRSTVLFSEEAVAEAGQALETFYRFFKRLQRVSGQDFYQLDAARHRPAGEFDPGDDPTLQAVAQSRQRFLQAMDDDFNTGGAIGDLFELVRALNRYVEDEQLEDESQRTAAKLAVLRQGATTLRELSGTLGLFREAVQPPPGADNAVLDAVMQLVLELRTAARQNKDFPTADRIRDAMGPLGILLEDRAGGTDWSHDASAHDQPLDGLLQLLIELRAEARQG